jgi:nicotinamidase-related amidase
MSKAALLIVDMVKDFTDPQGKVFYPENRIILPRIQRVLEECRRHNLLVIFLRHSYRQHKPDRNLVEMRPNCIEGTGGDEIDPMLTVDPVKDYVIKKRRYSGFFGTDLDLVLRENKIETVILTGTKTNCCIRATATDAHNLDYNVYVVADCVATNSDVVNQVHLEDIRKYLGRVVTSEELFQLLAEGKIHG